MIYYITVCKNTILSNLKHGTYQPPIRVSQGKYGKPQYYQRYQITGQAQVISNMDRPLPWGAKVWIEEDKA